MIYPDYKKNNIVNFASSILKAFGVKPLYPVLDELDDLKKYKNVIFLLIDGLGYEYLEKYGQDSFLKKHLVKKLSSVFPSTTAAATTALETGVPAQQHGITAWFMWLKELGVVSTILPFRPRYGHFTFPNDEIERSDIYLEKKIVDKIKDESFMVYPAKIVDGKVNKKKKSLLPYKTMNGMFLQIKKIIKSSDKRKYVHVYFDKFDGFCHDYGCNSQEARESFLQIDKKISNLAKSLKKTNSTLVITADHGLLDTKIIFLRDHPRLQETLTLPLCGEGRAAFCYVHPDKVEQFENYIKTKLNYACELHKSKDLIKDGVFGLFEPHEKLKERVGDYILIMKENYILKDFLFKEKEKILVANHGGISDFEMYVPLIWIK